MLIFGRSLPQPFYAAGIALIVALAVYVPLALTLRADPSLQQRVQQLIGKVRAARDFLEMQYGICWNGIGSDGAGGPVLEEEVGVVAASSERDERVQSEVAVPLPRPSESKWRASFADR